MLHVELFSIIKFADVMEREATISRDPGSYPDGVPGGSEHDEYRRQAWVPRCLSFVDMRVA